MKFKGLEVKILLLGILFLRGKNVDIYKSALEKEKAAEHFYRDLSEKTINKGLKSIFSLLADQESKHRKAIEQLEAGQQEPLETGASGDISKLFEDIIQSKDFDNLGIDQIELYKKAQDIEKKSRDFYLEKAEQAKIPIQKKAFLNLAEEERKHFFLLDNIIEFVSRPYNWLENAEFFHLEEY